MFSNNVVIISHFHLILDSVVVLIDHYRNKIGRNEVSGEKQ